jgi:tetratricopeptide (TPR) repeat protein
MATVLVFLFGVFLDRTLRGGRPEGVIASAAGGLLFALHPIHVESVSWMAGRSDVICALFFLPSAWLLLGYLRRGGWARLVGALALGALAFLSKETALGLLPFTLAAVFLVKPEDPNATSAGKELSRAERRRRERDANAARRAGTSKGARRWTALTGVLLLTLVYLQVRASAIEAMRGSGFTNYVNSTNTSIGQKALDLFGSIGFYGIKSVWPPPQNAFIAEIPGGPTALLGFLLLAGFGVWLFLAAFRGRFASWRPELLASALFFAALSPSLLIALFGISETPLAERYLYIPSAGACLLAGLLLVRIAGFTPAKLRAALPIVVAALICIPAWIAIDARNAVWSSDRSFWEDAVAKNPDQGLPHLHMGLVHAREGDRNAALASYKKAVDRDAVKYDREGRSKAYNNIASIYVAMGEHETAISYCRKAIEEAGYPYPTPHYNWGLAAISLGSSARSRGERARWYAEAEARFRQAIQYNPRYTKAHFQLGRLLARSGNTEAAIPFLQNAARFGPTTLEGQRAREELQRLGR